MKLLTTNSKIDKSLKIHPEYEATILQMLPGKGICVNYKECISDCLAFKGFAKIYPSVTKSRKAKKDYFVNDQAGFLKQLNHEIYLQVKRAKKKGKTPVVRLNGFTDINWDSISNLIDRWSDFGPNNDSVIFYDYTADFNKVLSNRHPNYHLTFSYKGNNMKECAKLAASNKANIAAIDTPENRTNFAFNGLSAIDGDKHDFRFLDADNSIVWLSFKK